jgi:hypothetical protein
MFESLDRRCEFSGIRRGMPRHGQPSPGPSARFLSTAAADMTFNSWRIAGTLAIMIHPRCMSAFANRLRQNPRIQTANSGLKFRLRSRVIARLEKAVQTKHPAHRFPQTSGFLVVSERFAADCQACEELPVSRSELRIMCERSELRENQLQSTPPRQSPDSPRCQPN